MTLKKNTQQKLIVVDTSGTIPELGGISGPITSPCYVPIDTINILINHHRKVYEVNPENYNERVLLNLKTLRKENFTKKNTTVKVNTAPSITTTAPVRNSNDGTKDFSTDFVTPKVDKVDRKAKKHAEPVAPVPEEKKEVPASDFVKND